MINGGINMFYFQQTKLTYLKSIMIMKINTSRKKIYIYFYCLLKNNVLIFNIVWHYMISYEDESITQEPHPDVLESSSDLLLHEPCCKRPPVNQRTNPAPYPSITQAPPSGPSEEVV